MLGLNGTGRPSFSADLAGSPDTVIALRRKGVVRSKPSLVAGVEFRGWTGDGKLRHASFKGLRDGADGAGVFRR